MIVLPMSVESSWGMLYTTDDVSEVDTVNPVRVFYVPTILTEELDSS